MLRENETLTKETRETTFMTTGAAGTKRCAEGAFWVEHGGMSRALESLTLEAAVNPFTYVSRLEREIPLRQTLAREAESQAVR